MASNGPSIEDILAELEARYRRGEGRHQFDLTRRAPAPPAPTAPELPDDPGLAAQILSGAGTAMALPGRPFQALQREVYRRQFPGVPDEQIPDSGRMLQQAVLPDQAEADRTFTGEAARSATRAVGGMAVDPVSTGLILGAGGFAPKAIQGTLHLALAGMMGKAMYDRAREYLKVGAEKGYLSPEAGAPAGEFALDAALLAGPMALSRLRRGAPEAPPAEVPVEAPGAPGAPPPVDPRLGPSGRPPGPIGPRQPYESPSVTATRPGGDLGALESRGVEYGGLLQRYYARMRERGLGHEEALMVAEYEASRITTDIYGPEAAAGLPQPRVELGPGPAEPAPPKTEVGRLAEPAVAEAKAALEAAIAAADARGDWLEVGVLRRRLGELLITGKVAGESATPAEAPAPGGALPRPPGPGAAPGSPGAPFGSPGAPASLPPRMVPGPGGTMQAVPPPGPRPDARVEGQPGEPVVPGAATPVEAAGQRQAGARPGVQGLVDQAKDVAQGGTGEALPPGTTVVRGPTSGAATGATPTPVLPALPLPPTGAPAPPAPAPPPAVAGPPVPAPQAPALSAAPIQPLSEEVVAFAAGQPGPVNSSLLQRRFRVGYKQAQAWVQELQAAGIGQAPPAPAAPEPEAAQDHPLVGKRVRIPDGTVGTVAQVTVNSKGETVAVVDGGKWTAAEYIENVTEVQEPPAAPPATREPSAPATAPPAPAQAPRRRFRATFDLVSPVQNSRVTQERDFDAVDQLDLAGQVDALIRPESRQNTRIENLRFRDMGESPAEPPARPAAPAPPRERQPDQAPEGIARADMGRRKKGERSGVIVRAYDSGGRVLTQREYATAADAKPTLEAWKRAAAAGRRETRATELSDIEAKVAAAAPGEVPWPSAESVTIAKEWYDDGKRGTAAPALYRALRSARQLGVEVHPGWLEVFPDLKDVQATGRRKRGAGPEAPIARPIEEPMFQASEIRQSSGGDWHLVDRRGNWDSTKFKTREEAEAAARGVEVPLEPVAFEKAFAGRGTARPDLPEESRFGPGRYWADNRRVAEIFAEHRDNGAVEEGTATLQKPFVASAPNVHSPEFRRLVGLLGRRGIPQSRVMSAVTDDPVDAFAGLAKLVAPSGERSFWGGAPELNRLLREAGYDGIVGDTRDSPDLPNHRELVEFRPAAQAPARPVETTAPAKAAGRAPEALALEKMFADEASFGAKYLTGDELEGTEYAGSGGEGMTLIVRNGAKESATICTNCAWAIQDVLGPKRVEVRGFHYSDNPTASEEEIATDGHDFALVDGRFIVDPWMRDTAGLTKRAVFDLEDPNDAAEIKRLHGDPKKWEEPIPVKDNPFIRGVSRNDAAEPPAQAAPRAGHVPEPVDLSTVPAFDPIDKLGTKVREGVLTAIERAPEALRAELRREAGQAVLLRENVEQAESDVDFFKRGLDSIGKRIPNAPKKATAARQNLASAKVLYEGRLDSMRLTLKGVPDAGKIVKRIDQLLHGKGIRLDPEPRVETPLTPYVMGNIERWANETAAIEPGQAIEMVVEYAKEVTADPELAVPHEDVLEHLEMVSGMIDGLGQASLDAYFDIPGLGRKKIAAALAAGPDDPNWQKLVDYATRRMNEWRGFQELIFELSEPTPVVTELDQVATNLSEDLAAEPEAEGERHLDKTFMAGLKTLEGEPLSTQEAIGAIRERRGRLYARILTAYYDASKAAADDMGDVPFDIPDGGPDDGALGMESPRDKFGQVLIPGMLEAVMSTPQKPVTRDGKPAADFADAPLFTQEEDKKARAEEEKAKKAQKTLFSPRDVFNGRYGPPPRRPSPEQLEARKRWAEKLQGMMKGGGLGLDLGLPGTGAPGAPAGVEGQESAPPVGPERGGAKAPDGAGAAGSTRGGGRRRSVPAGVPGGSEGAGGATPSPARQGIFQIVNPREEATFAKPPKYELIPEKLRGVGPDGKPLLTEEQRVGIAKSIEALEAGVGFLFEDGTGVGKTREILGLAEHFRLKGQKVLIVSKASAIEAVKRGGKFYVTGSYDVDSRAMGVPIEFKRAATKMEPGNIYVSTYHNLRDQPIDQDTVLIFDESHQLKNAGDSEVAQAGIAAIRKAKVTAFASATPGDKPYHMVYLTSIGLLEGKTLEQAMTDLGCVIVGRTKFSKKLYAGFRAAGMSEDEARKKATEEIKVWRSTSSRKTNRAVQALFERLTAKGTVIKREVDMSPLEVVLTTVPVTPEMMRIIDRIAEGPFDRKNMLMHMRRQLEPEKLAYTQQLIGQELDAGRSVVVFASRVNVSKVEENVYGPDGEIIGRNTIMESEGTLKQLRAWLKSEGIEYAEIHGAAEESNESAQRRFQENSARVVIATYEKGGTGINLDDRTGLAARTMIMMTSPFDSTSVVQAIGRIHRMTTRSAGRIHILFSPHKVDQWNAAIVGTKIKQLHAMVSGDIGLLDPELLLSGEEAIQEAGEAHYKDIRLKLLGHAPQGVRNDLGTAKHFGAIVHWLKRNKIKMTLKGGDFEIPTLEGYVIEGKLEKVYQGYEYRHFLTWNDDPEAGDLIEHLKSLPPSLPPKEQAGYNERAVYAKLSDWANQGGVKRINTQRQYEYFRDVLNRFGAVWGWGGKPGNFSLMTREGFVFTGELVPGKFAAFGRTATAADDGVFTWQRLDSTARTGESERSRFVTEIRVDMDELVRRIRAGEQFKDFYERHERLLGHLFGDDAELFKKILAVTSQATSTAGNVTLALKAYKQMRLGLPLVGYLPAVRAALRRIAKQEGGYARGPKITQYDDAMLERDLDAMAVDRHIARFILGAKNLKGGHTPNAKQREFIKKKLREAMKILGWTGREVHAAAWAAQQMETGLSEDEVKTYDEILRAKAREIHRFRRYFGDVGVARGWVRASGRSAQSDERTRGPIDPGAIKSGAGWRAPVLVVTRPHLRWGMKPERAGTGQKLPLLQPLGKAMEVGLEGVRFLGATVAEALHQAGRVKYEGLEVRYLEDLVALGQVARSTSLEHAAITIIVDGQIKASRQVTSLSPVSVTHGSQLEINEWVQLAVGAIEKTGVSRSRIKIAELHNHPSGDPTPSGADLEHAEWMVKQFGDMYLGDVVINHERGVVIKPGGGYYMVQRAQTFVDPDPLLQASVDHDSYWGTAADPRGGKEWSRLGQTGGLEKYTRALLDAGWGGAASDAVMLAFLDARNRVRGVFLVPKKLFLQKRWMVDFVGLWGRALGASSSVAAWEGHSQLLGAAATLYQQVGLVGESISLSGEKATWKATTENMDPDGSLIPWDRLNARPGIDPGWGMQTILQDDVDTPMSGGPAAPGGGGFWGGGAGDAGGPPPNRPGRADFPDDPDDSWWRRRVIYARMRVAGGDRSRRAIWDHLVLGVDAFIRGAKSFARWVAALLRDIPNIGSWGRRLFEFIQSIFAGRTVETTRRGQPPPFDDALAAAGLTRPQVRPIPPVTRADLDAALSGLDVRPAYPGAGRPLGVGRPRDLAINVNKIGDQEGLRQTLAAIIRAIESKFDAARLKKTEAEMRAEAEAAGLTQADIQRMIRENGALSYKEILALRLLRQEAGIDFVQKNQALLDSRADIQRARANGDEVSAAGHEQRALELEREMRASLHKLIGIMYGTAAAGAEAGRALYAHKMFIEGLTPHERAMRRLLRGTNPSDRLIDDLSRAIQAGDMTAVGRLYRQLHRPGFWRTVNEYFINSVLSGPATLGANIMGNLVHEGLRTTERGLAGRLEQFGVRQGIERILTGQASGRDRYVGEAMQALKAQTYFKFGLPQALELMWKATWTEDPRFMAGAKGEFYPPAIPGALGKVVRTPGRWMQALDLGAKSAASKGERAAQVFRKVTDEAHSQGGMTRTEFDRRMGEVSDELTRWIALEENRLMGELPTTEQYSWMQRNREYGDMYKAMKRAADESTFQDDTTRFTRYLQSMRNTYPFLTLIVPFIKTPERILVQSMRRTPVGLAKTLYNIQQGKIAGGLATDRLAQGMLGSAVMAGIYMMAKDGLITGGGPPDPDERRNWLKTGKQPYAVKIGKTWVSMARIEPLATTLGIAADLAEATDERVAGDLVDKLHFSVVNNITNKTYLEGITSFAEAMGDPDRYGARVWKRIIGAAVPNMLASAARAIDPTIRQTDTIKDTLMSRVPLMSEQVPARLTGTGEPVVRGETAISRFASPFRYSDEAGPEANLERLFLETGYNPAAPPKALSIPGGMGRKVTLTAEERRLYAEYARRATVFARALAKDGDWSKLDVYAKEEVLKRIYRFTHDAARRELYRSVFARAAKGEAKVVQ